MAELSDEGKAAIAEAIAILKSDGVHIHKTYAQFLKSQGEPPKDPANPPKADPKPGDPPPPKQDPPADPPKTAKRGLWWGDRE